MREIKVFMKNYQNFIVLLTFSILLSAIISAQSGGTFEITQSVVSNGGGTSSGEAIRVTGTTGQSAAGTNSTGGQFGVRGGFWQGFFSPTAAMVAISGRVLTAETRGISKARVTLTNANGVVRSILTNPFGNFRFDDVEAGQTYIISVKSKRYQFANETQVVFVSDEITGLDFNALPIGSPPENNEPVSGDAPRNE